MQNIDIKQRMIFLSIENNVETSIFRRDDVKFASFFSTYKM